MCDLPVDLKNEYILIQDIKDEKVTKSGLYIPDANYNRFSRVVAVYDGCSLFNVGDIIIKPIGRTTPIRLTYKETDENGNEVTREDNYDCIKEGLIFAKIIDV